MSLYVVKVVSPILETSVAFWSTTVSPQVIEATQRYRLPLLSARPAVTSPATEHHRPFAGTKLYCLVTVAHVCKQLAEGCTQRPGLETYDLLIASPAP